MRRALRYTILLLGFGLVVGACDNADFAAVLNGEANDDAGAGGSGGGGGGQTCSDSQNVVTCPSYRSCTVAADCTSGQKDPGACNGRPISYACVQGDRGPFCCEDVGSPCNVASDCCPGLNCNHHVCSTETISCPPPTQTTTPPTGGCPSGTKTVTGKDPPVCLSDSDCASGSKCNQLSCVPTGAVLCSYSALTWVCPSDTTSCARSSRGSYLCCVGGTPDGGASTGDAGATVCEQSSQAPLCSCASTTHIDSCSISPAYGHQVGSCGQDCCKISGNCCDCAASSYLSTLGLTCDSWGHLSGATPVARCPR